MFQRIKRAYKELTRTKPPELPEEELKKILAIDGDGKAEFLGEGTEAEWEEQKKKDDGMDKWYKRILHE